MDITLLVYYALAGLVLIGADAYLYADSIVARLEVATKYADRGWSPDFATTIFSREMQTIFANESLIRVPQIRAANEQSAVSMIAGSLSLDGLTFAFQHLLGLDPVEVQAAMLEDDKDGHIVITGAAKGKPPFALIVARGAGEEMPRFIRRAALEAAIQLDPYHAALYLLEKSDAGDHKAQLKNLLQARIDALPPTPESAERALLRNLQGITALLENDINRAAGLFEQTVRDADYYAAGLLNLGFARVEQDRYQDAIEAVRPVLEGRTAPRHPAIDAAAHTITAVSHWALKRPEQAERHFIEATRAYPAASDAYEYWALMLRELGRTAESEEKHRIGAQNLEWFEQYPEVATLYFWLTEKDNVPLARRTLPHP